MTDKSLTSLEVAILEIFHAQYGRQGFPSVHEVSVVSRKNTGAGRLVKLSSDRPLSCPDGYLDMGGHFIEMSGIEHGLMAVVAVVHSLVAELEIATYGDIAWDGVERVWKII